MNLHKMYPINHLFPPFHCSMFMTVNEDDDTIVCDKQKAGKSEMLKIRSNSEREEDKEVFIPVEERGNVGQIGNSNFFIFLNMDKK